MSTYSDDSAPRISHRRTPRWAPPFHEPGARVCEGCCRKLTRFLATIFLDCQNRQGRSTRLPKFLGKRGARMIVSADYEGLVLHKCHFRYELKTNGDTIGFFS